MSILKIRSGTELLGRVSGIAVLALIFMSAVVLSSCGDSDEGEQLRIGYLGDYEGWSDTVEMQKVVELAIDHINMAGGVNGMDVKLIYADAPENVAVETANRLIEQGVSAFVGPSRSAIAEPVAEKVAGVKKVPFISPGSTATHIRDAEDMDFMFRMALPDLVQGKVLADLISENGINKISILYDEGDSYSAGLEKDFTDEYTGTVQESMTVDMADSLTGGTALLVIDFPNSVRDALKKLITDKKFEKYYFTDSTKSEEFLNELKSHADSEGIAPDPIEGSKGTGPVEISDDLKEAFNAKYNRYPNAAFLAEAYDATVALALAAQMAGSFDSTAIRDNLRSVTSGEGEEIMPGVESLKKGLELAGQGDAINYNGASGSIDWDSDGEVCSAKFTTWQYTNGKISTLSEDSEVNPGGVNEPACM